HRHERDSSETYVPFRVYSTFMLWSDLQSFWMWFSLPTSTAKIGSHLHNSCVCVCVCACLCVCVSACECVCQRCVFSRCIHIIPFPLLNSKREVCTASSLYRVPLVGPVLCV